MEKIDILSLSPETLGQYLGKWASRNSGQNSFFPGSIRNR